MATSSLYQSLDTEQHHIRLLRLHPGQKSQPVVCDLYSVLLECGQSYEALSYVWGNQSILKVIRVNGQPFSITENLYDALRRLRSLNESRVLWIDAICINQKDDLEKGCQVDLMSRIYSLASGVVVWLGDVCPKHETSAAHYFTELKGRNWPPTTSSLTIPRDEMLYCSTRLIDAPWLTRSWTVQEAVFARTITVMLGPAVANFEDIVEYQGKTRQVMYDLGSEVRDRFGYNQIADMKVARQNSDKCVTFLEVIEQFWAREATDPRDKIYAFLGLVIDWQGYQPISPDYTLNADAVFAKAAFEIIRRQRSLKFLYSIGKSSDELEGEPSWVPRFTTPNLRRAGSEVGSCTAAEDIRLYSATVLSLVGHCYGVVSSVSATTIAGEQLYRFETDNILISSYAPRVSLGDQIWVFEEDLEPFILRSTVPLTIEKDQKEETVQAYKLVSRCGTAPQTYGFQYQDKRAPARVYLC